MTEHDDWSGLAFDAQGNLVDTSQPVEVMTYGPPPPVRWVQPADMASTTGLRCALSTRDGVRYDLRCASEVFEDSGGLYVHVVSEAQWYRWLEVDEAHRPPMIPRATCIPARHVWVATSTDQNQGKGTTT